MQLQWRHPIGGSHDRNEQVPAGGDRELLEYSATAGNNFLSRRTFIAESEREIVIADFAGH